jgi:hypothetical protein
MAKISETISINARRNNVASKHHYEKSSNKRVFQVGDHALKKSVPRHGGPLAAVFGALTKPSDAKRAFRVSHAVIASRCKRQKRLNFSLGRFTPMTFTRWTTILVNSGSGGSTWGPGGPVPPQMKVWPPSGPPNWQA